MEKEKFYEEFFKLVSKELDVWAIAYDDYKTGEELLKAFDPNFFDSEYFTQKEFKYLKELSVKVVFSILNYSFNYILKYANSWDQNLVVVALKLHYKLLGEGDSNVVFKNEKIIVLKC